MTDPYDALDPFLSELESKAPTPGGGAVAGLCGALAAALTHMVASLTVGKKKYADVSDEFTAKMPDMVSYRKRFEQLMRDDVTAFGGYMAALKLPKETDDEKAARREALRLATLEASEVPLQTLELAGEILPLVRFAAEKGNKNAVSDAGIAALLVTCAAKSAAMNVQINLAGLKGEDAERVGGRLERSLGPTLEEAAVLEELVRNELS